MKRTWDKNAIITWEGEQPNKFFPWECGDCKFWNDWKVKPYESGGECLLDFTVKGRKDGCGFFEKIKIK